MAFAVHLFQARSGFLPAGIIIDLAITISEDRCEKESLGQVALVRLERKIRPPRAKPGVDVGAHCIAPCAGGRGELGGKPQGCPWVPVGGGTKGARPKADLTPFLFNN
jgi:hypothetical protein